MSQSTTLLISTYNRPDALKLVLDAVMAQTVLPTEIVIADDGSGEHTRELISSYVQNSIVPIIHVWHEDEGFRRTVILNKAIAQAHGDYIIQIDGDVVPDRHFVQDHLFMMQKDCYMCGSRVKLSPETTQRIVSGAKFQLQFFESLSLGLNSLRCLTLSKWLAFRYGRNPISHMRGCNMAFWKSDFLQVNGYNEDIIGWGAEDSELALRFLHLGLKKKVIKFAAVVYHLWHKEASMANRQQNFCVQERTQSENVSRCDNGVDKYL